MVKIERTPTPPPSLATEKLKLSGKYNKPDVVRQLAQDFHRKCYLCEIQELQDPEVEHLRPHKGDIDRKFDWNNLFLSCGHCNGVKNQEKYDDKIIDCCVLDPESVLDQRLYGEHVVVKALDDSVETHRVTAQLLTECFELRNHGIRELGSQTRINELSKRMNILYKGLEEYKNTPSNKNLRTLRGLLSRSSKFAGFTRTYVRSHLTDYPDLAEYVEL